MKLAFGGMDEWLFCFTVFNFRTITVCIDSIQMRLMTRVYSSMLHIPPFQPKNDRTIELAAISIFLFVDGNFVKRWNGSQCKMQL